MSTRTITCPIGSTNYRIHVPADFDQVLDRFGKETPHDYDRFPYYATLWPSAIALATYLHERFDSLEGRTVIELGCGPGLPAMVAARLGGTVTATDFHPDNEAYFRRNAEANGVGDIEYRQLDWREVSGGAEYDLVLGSDVLYERQQIQEFTSGAAAHCATGGRIIVADPGRAHIDAAVAAFRDLGYAERLEVVDDSFVVEVSK